MSSNDGIIVNKEMGVRCNKSALAYLKILSRYLSGRDSGKSRTCVVNSLRPARESNCPLSEVISFRWTFLGVSASLYTI